MLGKNETKITKDTKLMRTEFCTLFGYIYPLETPYKGVYLEFALPVCTEIQQSLDHFFLFYANI